MTLTIVEILLVALGAGVAVLTPLAVFYARRTALALAKLADVKVSDDQLQQLERYVTTAIAYVEERTHKYLRGLVEDAPKTGVEKQAMAVQVARELAPDGLKQFSDKAVAVVVDAKVQDRRVSIPMGHLSIPPPGVMTSSFPPAPALPTPPPPARRAP